MAPLLGKIERSPSLANLLATFGVGSTIGRVRPVTRRPTTNFFSTPCPWVLASTASTLVGYSVTTVLWNGRHYNTSFTLALWRKLFGMRFANFFPFLGQCLLKTLPFSGLPTRRSLAGALVSDFKLAMRWQS